jgi:hypothetical protein
MQGRAFVHKGITLLSGIDPVRRADKTADAVLIKERTLYFCPSPLYGYGLSRLLSRLETEVSGSAILCVEADSELYQLTAANIDNVSLSNKKLHITNISEPGELCSLMRKIWGERAFRRVELLRFTGGWQLYPKLYDAIFTALKNEIAAVWSNVITLAKMGRLYIRNAFRNLALLTSFPSINTLSFGYKPVLVLGAGPSLDDFLNILQERRCLCGRENRPFKIICVDTCLGALKDRNIIPDLAVILESQHWNLADFTGCRGWEIPFALDLSALPQSAKQLTGQGYLFMTPWTRLCVFERLKQAGLLPAQIPPLGSVGLSALEIARRLTSGIIICAGLDFSFTLDKYHARSAPGHRLKLNNYSRLHGIFNTNIFNSGISAIISKSGEQVYTNPALLNYRALFEQEFSNDKRLLDIRSSGLPLGIKTLTPYEALNQLTDSNYCEDAVKNTEYENPITTANVDTQQIKERITEFLISEKERLSELRGILTGDKTDTQRIIPLLDECDYLYSHFPDSRPSDEEIISGKAVSFLNRVRMEIEGTVKIIEKSLNF